MRTSLAIAMCVVLIAHLPIYSTTQICLPSKCEFNQIESTYFNGDTTVINTTMSYDAEGQRVSQRTNQYVSLDFYTQNLYVNYYIQLPSGKCQVVLSLNYTGGFPARCRDYQHVRDSTIAGSVTVSDYQSSDSLLQIVNNAEPMNEFFPGFQYMDEYQNFSLGIKNPDVFNVPAACKYKPAKVTTYQGKLPPQRADMKHKLFFP